jgi:3-oxo-5-alpha-steroid 4-dehydrogenase 1
MYLPNKIYEIVLVIAIAIIPINMLFFSHIPTPYGRFYKKDIWGPELDEKTAWCIMESTALFMFLIFYFLYGVNKLSYVPLFFLSLWVFHYINRSFIYPFVIMKQKYKKFPLLLVVLGFFYLSMFSYLNAKNISSNPKYTMDWFKKPIFIIGVIIFFIGFIINVWADCKLQHIKEKDNKSFKKILNDIGKIYKSEIEKYEKLKDTGKIDEYKTKIDELKNLETLKDNPSPNYLQEIQNYIKDNDTKKEDDNYIQNKEVKIYEPGKFNFSKMFDTNIYFEDSEKKHYHLPTGGLYNYISSPNYLGEILEWSGWAIATWSLPGLLFALGAVGCIGVRAIHTHKWYEKHFENLPKDRKALIPFIL